MIKNRLAITTLVCMFTFVAHSLDVKSFQVSDSFPEGLDLDDYSSPAKLPKLSQIKWYQNKSEYQKCAELSQEVVSEKSFGIWLPYVHLSCIKSWMAKDSKIKIAKLLSSFDSLAVNHDALLQSQIPIHKEKLLDVYLNIANLLSEKSRTQFDDFINKYGRFNDHLSSDQRGVYYKILGEVAWLKQKNELAISNFLRSYEFRANSEVLKRLKTLKADGALRLNKYSKSFVESPGEAKLWAKFSRASRKGQTYKVAEYGSQFLREYPGSERIDTVRDDVNTFFKRLLYRRGRKYKSLKKDFEKQLMKAPSQYVYFWATEAYSRGYQDSSYRLGSSAVDKWEGEVREADALILTARSAFYVGKRSKAKTYLKKLIEEHSGHPAAGEGQYLLGLLHYREGDFKKVINLYDQFLESEGSDKWELQVRYWLYRSLKKMESGRTSELAESILKEFPLTYYGLRVRMEEKGKLKGFVADELKQVDSPFWWTEQNQQRWQRIKQLVSAGWINEAETEIDFLPDPELASAFVVRAKLWVSAGLQNRAIQDYAAAIDRDHRFLTQSLLEFAFPKKYEVYVSKAEKEFSISRNLVWSIMRQESAFVPRAVSPSRAYGLMQLLKPTGQETADWLKVKNFKAPYDLFKPAINVRFGTHFISRMARKYKTVVPLAIASYNVGPGNLDRWLSHRDDLKEWDKIGQSPDDDIWMDELPWAETSFYVKAVMRNYLLYKIIHEGADTLADPPWDGAKL